MAVIRIDNELDQWLEEVAALPADVVEDYDGSQPIVPIVDMDFGYETDWNSDNWDEEPPTLQDDEVECTHCQEVYPLHDEDAGEEEDYDLDM